LARRMVSEWGMGEQTGPVIYDLSDGSPSLNQPPLEGHERVYSEVTAERLDAEVERLIAQAHQQARSVLSEHARPWTAWRRRCCKKKCSSATRCWPSCMGCRTPRTE